MMNIYTLQQIFPALKKATDEEIAIIRDGLKMVSVDADKTPIMELEYALNGPAREIVRQYAVIV